MLHQVQENVTGEKEDDAYSYKPMTLKVD